MVNVCVFGSRLNFVNGVSGVMASIHWAGSSARLKNYFDLKRCIGCSLLVHCTC